MEALLVEATKQASVAAPKAAALLTSPVAGLNTDSLLLVTIMRQIPLFFCPPQGVQHQ
jgi:hypothetical protein